MIPTQWHPPTTFRGDDSFNLNPYLPQDPFMQWTQWNHQQNQLNNAKNWTNPDALVVNRPGEPVGPSRTYVSPPGSTPEFPGNRIAAASRKSVCGTGNPDNYNSGIPSGEPGYTQSIH